MKMTKMLNELYSYTHSKQTKLYVNTPPILDESFKKELHITSRLIRDIENKLHVLYQLNVCKDCNKPQDPLFYFVCPAYDIRFFKHEEAKMFCDKFNLLEVHDK